MDTSDSADYTIPVIDNATQQRYFNALKSHYFGMDSEAHSPWNGFYITALLKKTQHRRGMPVLSSFLATAVLIGGKLQTLYLSLERGG